MLVSPFLICFSGIVGIFLRGWCWVPDWRMGAGRLSPHWSANWNASTFSALFQINWYDVSIYKWYDKLKGFLKPKNWSKTKTKISKSYILFWQLTNYIWNILHKKEGEMFTSRLKLAFLLNHVVVCWQIVVITVNYWVILSVLDTGLCQKYSRNCFQKYL